MDKIIEASQKDKDSLVAFEYESRTWSINQGDVAAIQKVLTDFKKEEERISEGYLDEKYSNPSELVFHKTEQFRSFKKGHTTIRCYFVLVREDNFGKQDVIWKNRWKVPWNPVGTIEFKKVIHCGCFLKTYNDL